MVSKARDERVAPHIYHTPHGWRVYIRRAGRLKAVRFKPHVTLEELETFVSAYKDEADRIDDERRARRAARGHTFADDVATYLALKAVKAMPSYTDRVRELQRWVRVFGDRERSAITTQAIDEQLQAWRDDRKHPQSPSSLNKYRTALMSLWTRLDGRGAANPVRQTRVFEEPPATARGVSYELIRQLLDAMPREQSRPVKGEKGSRKRGSLTRVRFELMAWTGMTPQQIKDLKPRHVNLAERWYISPQRRKGSRRPRHPRPEVKKPMTPDAHVAFTRFVELKAWGPFSTRSLRHSLERARKRVERELRKERRNNAIVIPHLRPYDFRHSFGTELYRQTGNLSLVAEMLDHSSLAMTKRYALGAVPDVLRAGMRAFQKAAGRRRLVTVRVTTRPRTAARGRTRRR